MSVSDVHWVLAAIHRRCRAPEKRKELSTRCLKNYVVSCGISLEDLCSSYIDQNQKLHEAHVTIGQYRFAEMEKEQAKEKRRMKNAHKMSSADKAMKAKKAMKKSKVWKKAMKA